MNTVAVFGADFGFTRRRIDAINVRMNRLPLIIILVLTILAQINPASCAGEWSLATGDENNMGIFHASGADPCHDPSDHPDGSGDLCQCPCHVVFQTASLIQPEAPAFFSSLTHTLHSTCLPGFAGDIFRPPLYI